MSNRSKKRPPRWNRVGQPVAVAARRDGGTRRAGPEAGGASAPPVEQFDRYRQPGEKLCELARVAAAGRGDVLARATAAAALVKEAKRVEARTLRAVRGEGMTWGQLGAVYGMSPQGARARYQRRLTTN